MGLVLSSTDSAGQTAAPGRRNLAGYGSFSTVSDGFEPPRTATIVGRCSPAPCAQVNEFNCCTTELQIFLFSCQLVQEEPPPSLITTFRSATNALGRLYTKELPRGQFLEARLW